MTFISAREISICLKTEWGITFPKKGKSGLKVFSCKKIVPVLIFAFN